MKLSFPDSCDGTKRARGRPAVRETVDPDTLLHTAQQVFARHGYEAASVREIARTAGVDAALIAHRFGSKQELWTAIIDRIAQRAEPMVEATRKLAGEPMAPRERVERALALFVDRVIGEPDLGLFFSTAALEDGERLDLLVERVMRPYYRVLTPLLAAAMDAGEMARHDPMVMSMMLLNGITKTVSYSHLLGRFSSLPQRPRALRKSVLGIALSMLGR